MKNVQMAMAQEFSTAPRAWRLPRIRARRGGKLDFHESSVAANRVERKLRQFGTRRLPRPVSGRGGSPGCAQSHAIAQAHIQPLAVFALAGREAARAPSRRNGPSRCFVALVDLAQCRLCHLAGRVIEKP